MNLKDPLLAPDTEKWYHMLRIVNQNSKLLHYGLEWQFKKLFFQRFLTENLFIFILQYIGLNLSTLSQNLLPLWFATGTSCAYLFLRGYAVVPGIWLGTFAAYCIAKSGVQLAICCATMLSLQAVLLRWLSHYYRIPTPIFYRLKPFITFIIVTALLTCVISFILIFITYPSLLRVDNPFQLGLQWWLANFNAILLFTCALIAFDAFFLNFYAGKPSSSTVILFVLLLLAIMALILSHTRVSTSCFALIIMLLTVYISAHLGWVGAITAAFLTGMLPCLAGFLGASVFSATSISVSLLLMQLFLSINTILGLGVAIRYKIKRTT